MDLSTKQWSKFISTYKRPSTLRGGLSQGKKPSSYNQRQLKMGFDVEYHEHGGSRFTALSIAMDHLEEIPDYYTRLKKMEEEGKLGL